MAAENTFHFKQFSVNQSNCAMKVNTDGVLLGALAAADDPLTILDIGAGTGVIALMLAQRYPEAKIYAVEIDGQAAHTAHYNFARSPFADRLTLFTGSFEEFYRLNEDKKFDLIVSNPPFFLNSLKSEAKAKEKARHTDTSFFDDLFSQSARQLTRDGKLQVILPVDTVTAVSHFAQEAGLLLENEISVHSYFYSKPHRKILSLGFDKHEVQSSQFIIYADEKVYSEMYRKLLKDFLTIF